MTSSYTIWHNHMSICLRSNALGRPHIYSQTSWHQSPKRLWLTSFHNPCLCLDIRLTFTLGINILIKCVHFTYLQTMLYIHIPLSSNHLGSARTLGSRATSKRQEVSYEVDHQVLVSTTNIKLKVLGARSFYQGGLAHFG